MKRKRPAPKGEPPRQGEPSSAPAEAARAETASAWDTVQVCAFTALLFLAMTVQTGRMSVLLPVLALALSIGRGPLRRLRERFCVPGVAFLAFAVVYGLAAVYASFGEYALNEFYKFMASFSLAAIVLARFDKRHVQGVLWGVAAVCAVISLAGTDAASGGPLFEPFCRLVGSLGGSFAGVEQFVWGQRVNGIYNDANITAGIFSLGCFCGLHLALTGKRRRERLAACLLTGMSGLGFFLALSRGAILCFGLALLAYLAAVGSGERARLFFLIFLHAVITVAVSMVVSRESMGGTLVPDAATLLCGLPVFLLYEVPARRLAEKLAGRGRALAAVAAGLALAAGIYAAAAFQITGPYTFFADMPELFRWLELDAGEYTITFETSAPVWFRAVPAMPGNVWLDGPEAVKEVSFTVEEKTSVLLWFNGEPGGTLEWARLSDGTEIPLDYPLLPRVLAERMTGGSFTSETSFTQRLQYDRDGWELFKRSPLLGKGPGSTEGLLTSVQPYFYESLFLHNHVLQIMCDCGLLGTVPFLAFLLGSAWLLLRRLRESRKEGGDPLAAALLACWVMANAHGLMEINFSIRAYQCEAFTLLLLPVVLYGRPLVKEKALRAAGISFNVVLCVYLGVFAFGLERHRTVERQIRGFSTGSVEAFLEQTRRWIGMDWFDNEQNKLNFVGNAVILGGGRYEEDAARYAADLRSSGTYTACTGLAEYYYLPRGEYEEMFAVTREAVAQEASVSDAWNQQATFYRDTVLPSIGPEDAAVFLEGVTALEDYLEAYSQGRQEKIQLTEESRAFLDKARSALENGLEGEAALLYLTIDME